MPRQRKLLEKSPAQSPSAGALVVPAHGRGAIRYGSQPGTNRGGTGRPPDSFRELMRDLASAPETESALRAILSDPEHPQFLRALEFVTERGYGKLPQGVEVTAQEPEMTREERIARIIEILEDARRRQEVAERLSRMGLISPPGTEGHDAE